jgi:GNAT superfamily N-acetyltransferase
MTAPTSATVVVRPATLDDSAAIAELSGQLGSPTTPEKVRERLRRISSDPRHEVFVAELAGNDSAGGRGGEVIGWLHVGERHLVHLDSRAEVIGLVVSESHRRRGAGRALMQRAEQWAGEHECRAVYLRSNVIRTWAHTFYEALGYRLLKTQKAILIEF